MIRIPRGKTIRIFQGGASVVGNIKMVLENDITLSLSSSFSSLLSGGDTKLFTLLGQLSRDLTGKGFSATFKQLGFQMWNSTEPISIPGITIIFDVDETNVDARKQVYEPMIKLMQLPLPSEGGIGTSLIPPGPSIMSLIGGDLGVTTGQITSVEIGNIIRLNNAVISKAEPTWSNETDENDFPIWGKISLDITSVEIATKQMILNREFEDKTL